MVTQARATEAQVAHHPIFNRFPRWEGYVPEGFIVNFLGVMNRAYYWQPHVDNPPPYPPDRHVKTDYPPFDSQYFEWIAVLEAVAAARDHFTMFELGAGYGYWTANAAAALKHVGQLPYTFVAVEAEPTHFKWMAQHFADNSLDPSDIRLIEAAVTSRDGKVGFHVGKDSRPGNADAFDQSIGGPHMVNAISLPTLLEPLPTVDLLHLDIQGAELKVLQAGARELDQKVKRVCVGTHSQSNDEGLYSLFARLGWQPLCVIPCLASSLTQWGTIFFMDGVQSWLNPVYSEPPPGELAVLQQKLEASRSEAERLFAELEKAREVSLPPSSIGWKLFQRARSLRAGLAPNGTRRRKLLDRLLRRI
jgi:FkbM family methyltransferase